MKRITVLAVFIALILGGAFGVFAAGKPPVQAAVQTFAMSAGDTLEVTCPSALSGVIGSQQADLVCAALPTATPTNTPVPTNTPAPTATSTPVVVAGQPCPAHIHDAYTTQAIDGRTYPTWHPSTDPATGCFFGHDHGNDPASVVSNYSPPFNYVGGESHHGFKVIAGNDNDGESWVITQHQGTTTRNALCGRHHEITIAVYEGTSLKAHLSFMGDFGQSRLAATQDALTPPECPENAQISSQGLRRIPITGDGYTPYNVNQSIAALGLRIHAQFLTTDGRTACPNTTCATLSVNGDNTGSRRRFQVMDNGLRINENVVTSNNGMFCTLGMPPAVVACTESGSVRQYLEPNYSANFYTPRADRLSNKSNGIWPYGGQFAPQSAVADGGSANGSNPLMPLSEWTGGPN